MPAATSPWREERGSGAVALKNQEGVRGCLGWGMDPERFEWVAAHDGMDGTYGLKSRD